MSCDVCMGINSSRCPVCGTDESNEMECPNCHGTGAVNCWGISVETGKPISVTPLAWLMLPWTKEDALAAGYRYFQGEADDCPLCHGTGSVQVDEAKEWRRSR